MRESLSKVMTMNRRKSIRLLFVLMIALCISQVSKAQIPNAKQTQVFQLAEQGIQADLERLLQLNPQLKQRKSASEMQRAFEKSIDVLPNPELGINWSPTPMQKSLNQTFAVRAMQMMPWPGTIEANVNAQHALTEQKEWMELASQLERLTTFRKTWYDGYAISKQLKWLEAQLKWIDTQQEDLQTKLTTGKSQSATIELEIERIQLVQKQFDLKKKLESNASLLDSYFGEKTVWEFPDTLMYSSANYTSFQLEHPLLSASSAKQKSSTYKHIAAKKEGLPMIGLGAEYMLIDEALKPVAPEMQMQSAFTVMATITLPVYRSKYNSMQAGAKSAEKEAQYEVQGIQQELEAEFNRLLNEQQIKEQELTLYGTTLPQKWNQLEEIALEKWQSGTGSFAEIIRIKRSKIELMQRYTSILTELKKNEADLNWLQPFAKTQIK